MNSASTIFFIVVVGIIISFTILIVDSIYSNHINTLTFFYELQYNDTFTNTSDTCMNVSLQRISEQHQAIINLTYQGGNTSDQVFVNGNYVGNLTPPSPDIIYVNPLLLETTTCVDYQFAGAVGTTNVTNMSLIYYRYDGCNYGESACVALDTTRNMSGTIFYLLMFSPILLGAMLLIGVVKGMI